MMITVKILNYVVFNEGLLRFEIDENTTVYDILKKIDEEYGETSKEYAGRKLLDDIKSNYRIFLNNNYLEISATAEQEVKDEDYLLILKPISGG
jgi:sulfur carrier protein ThiS